MQNKIIFGLVVILCGVIWYGEFRLASAKKDYENLEAQIVSQYEAKYLEQEKTLSTSAAERVVLVSRIATLRDSVHVYLRSVETLSGELKTVKGRYNKIKPSKLGPLMDSLAHGN